MGANQLWPQQGRKGVEKNAGPESIVPMARVETTQLELRARQSTAAEVV